MDTHIDIMWLEFPLPFCRHRAPYVGNTWDTCRGRRPFCLVWFDTWLWRPVAQVGKRNPPDLPSGQGPWRRGLPVFGDKVWFHMWNWGLNIGHSYSIKGRTRLMIYFQVSNITRLYTIFIHPRLFSSCFLYIGEMSHALDLSLISLCTDRKKRLVKIQRTITITFISHNLLSFFIKCILFYVVYSTIMYFYQALF